MTVNPGFGGQSFLHGTLAKIRTLRRMIDAIGSRCELEVDGGIDPETAPLVVEAGARVLVAGSSIYGVARGRGCRDGAVARPWWCRVSLRDGQRPAVPMSRPVVLPVLLPRHLIGAKMPPYPAA